MRAGTWWRLLIENGFRVTPSRIPMALALTLITPANDLLAAVQRLRHGRKLRQTALSAPPLFIIGHWRSGTTLLHELMMHDPEFACPSTYQCFAPTHFLVSEWFFHRFGRWMLPNKRPMDNVAAGWDRPQEDEFALMNLGLPSPYRRIAFPGNPIPHMEYLDLAELDNEARQRWLEGLEQFLAAVSAVQPGRVVLKSPTHTGRVGLLREHFPGAKFIHITRDPRSLFPSTLRLWHSLDSSQGLQKPAPESTRRYVLDCLEKMYAAFHRDRQRIPEQDLIDIRYEDLVADPLDTLRRAYAQLDLGNFQRVEPTLRRWVEEHHRGYQPNQHHLPAEDETTIRTRWADYFERYGYAELPQS
jgi:hypothetical protein